MGSKIKKVLLVPIAGSKDSLGFFGRNYVREKLMVVWVGFEEDVLF